VRTRAYELRQKLDKLYSTELQAEAIQIVVPKGAYTPHYVKPSTLPHADSLTEVTPAAKPVPADTGIARQPRATWLWMLAAAVFGAAGDICGFAVAYPQACRGRSDRERGLGPLAKPGADVLLCAATPLHLVVGPGGHEAYGSPKYPAPPEAYPLFRQHSRSTREQS
jgi:hypothetical protein